MHQTRQATSTKIPVPRKGTKYIARANSNHKDSVPVVVAVRDMLHLAKTSKEVKKMVSQKLLKLNGKPVKDIKESISLLNLFEADKPYLLTLTSNGRFTLEETKDNKQRIAKIIGKKLLKSKKLQFNLHDGTNLLGSEKASMGDSLSLDLTGKVKGVVKLDKGSQVLIFKGKYSRKKAKDSAVEGKKATLKLTDK